MVRVVQRETVGLRMGASTGAMGLGLGDGVGSGGQPLRALLTAAMSSSILTTPSVPLSNASHCASASLPSAMFTPAISSSTVTFVLELQSPMQTPEADRERASNHER